MRVVGGASEQLEQAWRHETWLYQIRGEAEVRVEAGDDGSAEGAVATLREGACAVVPAQRRYSVRRAAGSSLRPGQNSSCDLRNPRCYM